MVQGKVSTPGADRTHNLRIRSPTLCPLSYRGIAAEIIIYLEALSVTMTHKERPPLKKVWSFDFKKPHGKTEMKKICKCCRQLLDQEQFDMWFPAIRVRKDKCKKCERRQRNE